MAIDGLQNGRTINRPAFGLCVCVSPSTKLLYWKIVQEEKRQKKSPASSSLNLEPVPEYSAGKSWRTSKGDSAGHSRPASPSLISTSANFPFSMRVLQCALSALYPLIGILQQIVEEGRARVSSCLEEAGQDSTCWPVGKLLCDDGAKQYSRLWMAGGSKLLKLSQLSH